MSDHDYYAKIRWGLFERKHFKRMGSAVWLFGWLFTRADWETGRVKWNMGEVASLYGVSYECVRKWRRQLERQYITTEVTRGATGYLESVIKKWVNPLGEKMGFQTVTDTVTHTVTDTVTPTLLPSYSTDITDDSELTTTTDAGQSVTGVTHSEQIKTSADFARIARLYEGNFGALTSISADLLKDALTDYPADWIAEAIAEAVKNNARKWPYAEACLKNWKTNGFKAPKPAARNGHRPNGNGHGPQPAVAYKVESKEQRDEMRRLLEENAAKKKAKLAAQAGKE